MTSFPPSWHFIIHSSDPPSIHPSNWPRYIWSTGSTLMSHSGRGTAVDRSQLWLAVPPGHTVSHPQPHPGFLLPFSSSFQSGTSKSYFYNLNETIKSLKFRRGLGLLWHLSVRVRAQIQNNQKTLLFSYNITHSTVCLPSSPPDLTLVWRAELRPHLSFVMTSWICLALLWPLVGFERWLTRQFCCVTHTGSVLSLSNRGKTQYIVLLYCGRMGTF